MNNNRRAPRVVSHYVKALQEGQYKILVKGSSGNHAYFTRGSLLVMRISSHEDLVFLDMRR